MPVFICSRCGCIDNSACENNFWNVRAKERLYQRKIFNEAPVCESCTPCEYNIKDEKGKGYMPKGKWHNMFEKRFIKDYTKYTKEELINMEKRGDAIFENAIQYFEKFENMTTEEFDKLAEEIDPEVY